jgi:hypothetical protein
MRWIERKILPQFPPVNPETGLTHDPDLRVLSLRFTDAGILQTSPLWQTARLTKGARQLILNEDEGRRVTGGSFAEGWLVRRLEEREPCAIVLKLSDHYMRNLLVSAAPERTRLNRRDRLIVLTADLVIAVRGADESRAFGNLGDVLVGTRRGPRRRAKPVPAEDIEALRWL